MHVITKLQRSLRVAAVVTGIVSSLTAALSEETPSVRLIGYVPLSIPNACLPDAIGFRTAYAVYQRSHGSLPWARLLLVYHREGPTVRAHAYCVFSAEGKLWTYDQVTGSQRAWIDLAEKNNAEKLGRQLAAQNFVRAAWVDTML